MSFPASALDVHGGRRTIEFDGASGQVAMVRAGEPMPLMHALPELRGLIEDKLPECGALLLRGFEKVSAAGFNEAIADLGLPLLGYEYGSTPRKQIDKNVYSSTEYPAHQWIPQHNEQSYTTRWPARIYFYCDQPAKEGGDTPISDSQSVYQSLSKSIRTRFAEKKLMYVRNYGSGLDLPWSQVFGTADRHVVEQFCRQQEIAYEWFPDDGLRTRQICQSEARHPKTGAIVWFNQAHLFHISALEPALRETLLSIMDEADVPRNVFYGDGKPLEEDVLQEIRNCYQQAQIAEPWQEGDLLILDNMLFAHGRAPFEGPRRILVGMAGSLSRDR